MGEIPNRFEINFHILNKWLMLRQRGKTLEPFFQDNALKKIAVYGMGVLGERLIEELQLSSVQVMYGIDRMAAAKQNMGIKIYGVEENSYPETEAVIVTPVQDYWNIVSSLANRTSAPVLSIEDIIDYCCIE